MRMVFGSLMGEEGWTPVEADEQGGSGYSWYEGSLSDAPTDIGGAVQTSTEPIDAPAFGRRPFRVRPNFTVPRHHNTVDEMIVVLKGECLVEYGETGRQNVGPGQFFLVRAGTPYTMTAGPGGVTYLEMWPRPDSEPKTFWDDAGSATDIEFYNLLDDKDWPIMGGRSVLSSNPTYFWHDGRPLVEAPIDMEATFEGAMWLTTKVDPSDEFRRNGWNGLRCRPNFMVPRHYHNMRELIIVFGGEYNIKHDDEDGKEIIRRVGPGEFFISQPGTPYTMIAGPQGVTYTECWPDEASKLETYWLDEGWIHT
jgi:quercetin dioxygenase-like cupin family protein